jgi:hypothetical protein
LRVWRNISLSHSKALKLEKERLSSLLSAFEPLVAASSSSDILTEVQPGNKVTSCMNLML